MPVQPDDLLLVNRGGQDYKYPANDFLGPGIAEGGIAGECLTKKSEDDYDTEWSELPSTDFAKGGSTGQVLKKRSAVDFDIEWSAEQDLSTYATKQGLATATEGLPYILETDKTVRSSDLPTRQARSGDVAPAYAGGEIYLTDNIGFYSNVRFSGTGNVSTSSDTQGIIVDGSALMPKNLLSLPELS